MSFGSRTSGRAFHFTAALALVVGTLGVAVAGAGAQEDFPAVDQPGVSATEIRVGGVASTTNPLGGTNGSAFDGVEAYFEYVNKTDGGVYGRKLVLDSKRDDLVANNRSEVQGLISQDDVFAVLPVAVLLFTGADLLAESGIPTFGWNIQEEWGTKDSPGAPNLFPATGAFPCLTCGEPLAPQWVAKKLGLERAGVLAYNVPQSEGCAVGFETGFESFPTAEIVLEDKSLQFGNPDYTAQVARMIEEDVDLVLPCMDFNGVLNLTREMRKQGLDATQFLLNAYNHEFMEENAELFEGAYVNTVFAPFETRPKPKGLKLYEQWIKRTGGNRNENSIVGWINADMFVAGLKGAGPDFTRQKIVGALNAMTDYDAGALLPGIDWTTAHTDDVDCWAVSQVVDGKFKPVFGERGKPFMCLPDDLDRIPAKPEVKG